MVDQEDGYRDPEGGPFRLEEEADVWSIYRKVEVHSRGEAVYEALQLGIVKLGE